MSEEKLRKDETDPKIREAETEKEGAPGAAPSGVSETWAEETIADLDEFIESQGIYIRQ